MSTVKVDNITSSLLPLPVVDGVNEKQSHVSVAGQTQFAVTKFQQGSNLRVFVGKVEATWEWLAATTTIKINTPAIPAGSNIHIYRQIGELSYSRKATTPEAVAASSDTVIMTPAKTKSQIDSRLSSTPEANKAVVAGVGGKVSNAWLNTVGTGSKLLTVDADDEVIGDAPQDGKMYVRLNGAWVEVASRTLKREQLFSVVGTHTWTAPAKLVPESVRVSIAGGGCSGGLGTSGPGGGIKGGAGGNGAGGGSSGQIFSNIRILDVTPSEVVSVTVGGGGAASSSSYSTGKVGTPSSFGAYITALSGTASFCSPGGNGSSTKPGLGGDGLIVGTIPPIVSPAGRLDGNGFGAGGGGVVAVSLEGPGVSGCVYIEWEEYV